MTETIAVDSAGSFQRSWPVSAEKVAALSPRTGGWDSHGEDYSVSRPGLKSRAAQRRLKGSGRNQLCFVNISVPGRLALITPALFSRPPPT
ncbi:MAG TPA: hypothetical protein VGP73_18745 [Thermoanaerobaculia bacterium]